MHAKRKSAFTLLEIMVAVLIVGILLAVSGPIYTSYTTKSRFAAVFGTMNQLRDDLQVAYQDNDQFPASFSNSNINSATYNTLSSNVLQQVYYGISSSGQSAYLQFFTLDLGVSGYVESSNTGSGGVNCRVSMAAVTTSTGDTVFYCGQWDGSSMDVPLTYLPSTCQDTSISTKIV